MSETSEAQVARWLAGAEPPDAAALATQPTLLIAALDALDAVHELAPDDPDGASDLLEGLIEDALAAMHPGRRAALLAHGAGAGPRAASAMARYAAASTADPRVEALLAGRLDATPADGSWAAEAAETLAGLIDELALDGRAALAAEAWLLDPLMEAAAHGATVAGPVTGAAHRAGPPVEVGEGPEEEPPLSAPIPVEGPPGLPPLARPAGRGRWWVAALALAAALAVWVLRADPPPPIAPIPVGVTAYAPDAPPPETDGLDRLPATAHRPEMMPIPAGTATLGSPDDEPGRQADETRRAVTLTRAFWLARTEVTQGQWRALMGTDPARFDAAGGGGDDHPVEQVSWYDAVAYANRLSAAEGLAACYEMSDCRGEPGDGRFTCGSVVFAGPRCRGYRLPTEAEWEYAARAGTSTATYAGPFELLGERHAPVLDAIAWYSGNSGVERGGVACGDWTGRPPGIAATACGTHPVATRRPNRWGLHDMLGNVWEWTTDGHGPLPAAPQTDPVAPPAARMVTKGCGWFREARFCRAANRYRPKPDYRAWVLGLRVARTLDP